MLQWGAPATARNFAMFYLARWKHVAVVLLFIWILVTYLVISPLRCSGNPDEVAEYQARLRRVSTQLDTLRQQHTNLIAQIKSSGSSGKINIDPSALFAGDGPSEDYETLRRRIYTNTKELWYYIKSELRKVLNDNDKTSRIEAVLKDVGERKRSLLFDQQKLAEIDGHNEWRRLEAANVSDLIQRRLKYLQNPSDCREARKVICNLNKGCGFGCQLHHIAYCLIFAYATERTLILQSRGWRYNTKGWDYVFHPLSDSCTSAYEDKALQWPGPGAFRRMLEKTQEKIVIPSYTPDFGRLEEDIETSYDAKVISLPFIDSMSQKPKFLPLAIPKDLAHRILRFNGDPASWWVGQMIKFVLRPRTAMQKAINETIARMNFKTPIVGVHIRRTDKVGTEAAFHHVHEYMAHVAQYFDTLELDGPVPVRRVYLASDDANVLEDARRKYPQYSFVGDAGIAKLAATHRRYTPQSLTGLLVDLHLLAACDFLVATFSSQVGRVAYELMQANRVDASESFFSLDDIYYFGGQNAHDRIAVMPHDAAGAQDISFKVGDMIGIAGNHWNGYGRGTNRRTNANGLIPWYKTMEYLVLYPFPEYKEVPLYVDTRQEQ